MIKILITYTYKTTLHWLFGLHYHERHFTSCLSRFFSHVTSRDLLPMTLMYPFYPDDIGQRNPQLSLFFPSLNGLSHTNLVVVPLRQTSPSQWQCGSYYTRVKQTMQRHVLPTQCLPPPNLSTSASRKKEDLCICTLVARDSAWAQLFRYKMKSAWRGNPVYLLLDHRIHTYFIKFDRQWPILGFLFRTVFISVLCKMCLGKNKRRTLK